MLWLSIGPLEVVRRRTTLPKLYCNICMRGGGQKSLTRKIPKSKDQESLDLQNLYESELTFYQNEWGGLSSKYLSACNEKCILQYFQASKLNPHRGGNWPINENQLYWQYSCKLINYKHSKLQGTLGTQDLTFIESKTSLGPTIGHTGPLKGT